MSEDSKLRVTSNTAHTMFNNNAKPKATALINAVNKEIDTGMPCTTTTSNANATTSAPKTSSDSTTPAPADTKSRTQTKISREESLTKLRRPSQRFFQKSLASASLTPLQTSLNGTE